MHLLGKYVVPVDFADNIEAGCRLGLFLLSSSLAAWSHPGYTFCESGQHGFPSIGLQGHLGSRGSLPGNALKPGLKC